MSSKSRGTGSAGGEWRELTTVTSDAEARLVEGWLENEGIECELESQVFTQEPVQFGLFGGVRVHVPASELERAQHLLERLQSESGAVLDENAADEEEAAGDSAEEDSGEGDSAFREDDR